MVSVGYERAMQATEVDIAGGGRGLMSMQAR